MAKKWSDVAASAAFQSLSLDEQEEARNQYFEGIIAPQVDASELSAVRDQFFADTVLKPRGGRQELPADITPSEGRSATPMGQADPRIVQPRDNRGIIQRVGDFLRPEYKSVMEGYQPTPQEQQAELDKRLSYGAGPINQQTTAAADLVRSGMAKSDSATVNKVAKEMDRRGERSFGDLVEAAKNETNIKAARDAKAQEFRTAGEWAADTLASLASGVTTIAQLPTDIIAPSSSLAKSLRETQKELQGQESEVLQAQRDRMRERIQSENGFLDKYAATVVSLVTNPALGLSEAVKQVPMFLGVVGGARLAGGAVGLASNVSPTLALSEALTQGAVRASATAAGGAATSMVMAGGDAAGGVYEKLTDPKQTPMSVWKDNPDFQQLKAEGKSDKQAIEEIATAKARIAAVVTAPLGLLGFMGAESAVASRGLGKATADALTFAGAGKLVAKDVLGEQLEEGGTQFGGNVVSRTVDPNQKLSEGVPEAMGTALVTSAPFSAVGARSQYLEARDAQQQQPSDVRADAIARDLLDPNTYDPSIVSPTQTSTLTNFTPAGSPTQQAGLVDIEVPVPNAAPVLPPVDQTTEEEFGLDKLRMGGGNVGTSGTTETTTGGSGVAGGNQLGGGVDVSGSPVAGATGQLGGSTGLPAPDAAQALATGDAGTQRAADLSQENNNAVVQPAEQWFGRKGDGYATEADATQAIGGRQRMFPTLDWKIEQMPSGKFRLAGYSQETSLGTQTAQAQQTEAQGQAAPATGALAATPQAAAAAADVPGAQPAGLTLADEDRAKLKATAPAPVKAITSVRNEILKTGVEMSVVPVAEIDDQQRVAGALLRSLGKTLTVVRSEAGPGQLSNGMINRLGGQHIFIAEDTEDAPLFVATHEAYHGLPADKRKVLNTALLELFNEDQKQDFLKRFDYTEDQFDEEAPAFMAQAISKRADFWEQLRTKLGDAEFAEVAKVILAKFKQILSSARSDYGDDFVARYIKDVQRAQDLLSTAYAEAIQANKVAEQEQATEVAASNRATGIAATLQQRIESDFAGAVAEYNQLKGAKGGRVLDADIARELSPEYRADRSRAFEIHEVVSDFIQRVYEERMAVPGTGDIVAFMAGGGGAGKSSAEELLSPVLDRASTVVDGTLSSYDKAERNIQMALDSGRQVRIAYVYRDPVDALVNGVLKRARDSGGRTVPLDALVKGHAGSSTVVRKLQAKFGDNPMFKIFAVDNSRGKDNAVLANLEDITPVIIEGLKERFINATQQQLQQGSIDDKLYRSTIGGQADAGTKAQGQIGGRQVRQGNDGSPQQGDQSVGSQNQIVQSRRVTKDEAVVDGVLYSNRARDLADIPTIELRDLVDKKVFGIKADLTDAGRSYTGIDGSQLEFPVEMMGGPNYVRIPENVKSNVIWAVRGGATLSKILTQVKKADYILVHAMNGNSHLTNATVSTAYLQTVEAYLRDGRISSDNLLALDEIVRSPKNKSGLPDFPGFESPDIYSYIDGLSFDQRGALAAILEKKEAQVHGLPNLDRFRRETIDSDFAGYRQGDAMLVIEVDKENPMVKLGEEGTKLHPSYPLGLRGKVIGKLAKGVNYETIFRDYFQFAVPNFKRKEQDAWYSFDRVLPIQKITQEIADSVSPGGYKAINSPRQAEAALAMANGNWLVSGKTKAEGGVSVQEFVDALQANDGAAALTMYTAQEVKAGIKDGSMSVYQLGNQGGDKGLKVFFGLKRGAPWYKDMIDGVGDNEVEVVSVTNNESGAPGVGIPAIITKAISEGATVLDAFAVKSKRFPDGFLPEMYAQFGFEEIGRIPFDPQFYNATQMADLKAFWSQGGWQESDGYPDVVVMRWSGNDEDRATAVERYVREGETSISRGVPEYTRASTGKANQQRNPSRGAKGRARGGDAGQARGDQGAGNAAPVVRRAFDSIQEISELSDGDIRNLGLNPDEVERLRSSLAGVVRSNRLAEPARGSSARRDEGDRGQTVTGIHYGKAKGLSVLSGTSFGTGIKGAEQARLNQPGVDPRIKKRVYFYLTNNNADMPRPEAGLGSYVYRTSLGNMFDETKATDADLRRIRDLRKTPDANGLESAILDAGYRGYVNREQGTAVVLNADVPVAFEGMAEAGRMRDRVIERAAPVTRTREQGGDLVRKPTSEEMIGIIKARPALAKVAPSFKLEFGEARVKADEVEAADQALEDAGSSFRFGEVVASNRVQTDTPAFKKWFGDSKVVDAEGKPMVMYHGTDYNFSVFRPSFRGAYFVTPNAEFANDYTTTDLDTVEENETSPNIMPVYVRAENPFDYENAEHVEKVIEYLKKTNLFRGVQPGWFEGGRWDSMEDRSVQKAIKALGFDSFYVTEFGTKNLGVYASSQIKSAIGNNGEFDATNADITRSNRVVNLADDLAEQDKFLQQKAEEAGYKNIDDFVDQDYAGFVEAAAQWRRDNPVEMMMAKRGKKSAATKLASAARTAKSLVAGRDELGNVQFGVGNVAYRLIADLTNVVLDKMALKPISTDLSRAMRQMKVEIGKARELTVDVAGKLGKLSQQEREIISDVIEGELKAGAKPPKRILQIAASMQSIMSEQTDELVRLGMLSEDAAGRWDGKYLPRFYESKLKTEAKGWAKAAKALLGRQKTMQGIGGSNLKGRGKFQTIPVAELEQWLAEGWEQRDANFDPATDTEITVWRDYTRAERDDMGEIRDAMFRFVMGYNKSQRDISLGRLYENIANTVASKKEKEGYVQVPRTNVEDTYAKRYGKLSGMWVPQEVLDHLTAFDDSQRSELMKMYLKGMSLWKEGKTVLNPVSHANNVMSNITMAHFAGVSYWDIGKYIDATRELIKNSPMVKEAKDAGLWTGTMTQAELVQLLPDQLKVLAAKTESTPSKVGGAVWDAMSFWLRKPLGKAYEAEDLYFRYLIYRDARKNGLKPADAVDYAQKYIFTYDDLPKGARKIRDFALPFFAYTYKVVPTLAETALKYPWRYAAPAAALYTANAMMYAFAASLGGGEDEDWWTVIQRYVTDPEFRAKAKAMEADERKNLPPWMKGASLTLGTSKAIRLGADELTGLPVFLDVSRIFPGGDLFDAHNNAGGVPLLSPITPNSPILTTAYAMLANKDTFRGTEVVKPSDTDAEAARKRAGWVWSQFTPAIAVGNGHFDRAMNVIANQVGQPLNLGFAEYTGTDKQGMPVQGKYAAMQTVGVKARPIDLETSEAIQKAEVQKMIREIDAEINKIKRLERKGAISFENAERQREYQKEKRQRLKEGLTVDGDERE